jgi:hypothetical protein
MSNPPSGFGRGGRGAALAQLLNQQVRRPGEHSEGMPQQPTAFGTVQPQLPATVFGAAQTPHATGAPGAATRQTNGESANGFQQQQQPVIPAGRAQMISGLCGSSSQPGLLSSSSIPSLSPRPLAQPLGLAVQPSGTAMQSSVATAKPVELQPVSCMLR